jgi:integrase
MAFKPGHGPDSRSLADWTESQPLVKSWLSKKRPGTARKYGTSFRAYWIDHLSKSFKSVEDWVDRVKFAQSDPDFEKQTAWAKELEEYVTAQKLNERTRRGIASAVVSFLEPRIGRQNARNYKFTYATPEEKDSEEHESDSTTITYDDILAVFSKAKSNRDRALILTNLHGLGVGELVDFNEKWYQIYQVLKSRTPDARWKTKVEPVRVNLVRHKRNVKFYTMLTDDAIDALATLLDERESDLGRPLQSSDPLFVNYRNNPITEHRIQEQVRYLRDLATVPYPERIRPHEIGRDCFITLFALHHVGPFNAEGKSLPAEFCTGHTVDDLKYQKAAWTPKGEQQIREIFEQLRPELNLITRRGKETEIVKGTIDAEARRVLVDLIKMMKTANPVATGDIAEQALQLLEDQGITEAADRWSRRSLGNKSGDGK